MEIRRDEGKKGKAWKNKFRNKFYLNLIKISNQNIIEKVWS